MNARASLRVVAGLAIAATFLWLAFGRLDWSTITAVTRAAAPAPLVLGLAMLGAGFFVRITRWWWMLRVLEPELPLRACARPFLVSLAINNTMPLRAGDIVRAVGFREALRSPTMRVVGTLVIERVLDLCVLVALFFVGLLALPRGTMPRPLVTAAVVLGAAGIASLMVLMLAPNAMHALVDRILGARALAARRWVTPVRGAAHHLFDAFGLVQSPVRALQLLGLSVLAWFCEGSMYACVAWSLYVGGSLVAPWFAAATGTLATLIPSSPGYVGTFDYFVILGLVAFGAHRTISAAFAVIVHLMLWLPVTLVGAALLVPRSARTLRRLEQQESAA